MFKFIKYLYKTFITDPAKKKELLDWLVEHDTPEYHKNPLPVGYYYNRLWYEEMETVNNLEMQKREMLDYYNKNHSNTNINRLIQDLV